MAVRGSTSANLAFLHRLTAFQDFRRGTGRLISAVVQVGLPPETSAPDRALCREYFFKVEILHRGSKVRHGTSYAPVSYTHLTLPTKRIV